MQRRTASLALGLALCLAVQGFAQAPAHLDTATSGGRTPAFDVSSLDRSVKPGDDFYQFANGGWLATHPIPPEFPRWGRFTQLSEENTERLHQILEDDAHNASEGNAKKLGDFYQSGMDEAAINAAGLQPIAPDLARIDAIRTPRDLEREIAWMHGHGIHVFFMFGSDQDAKNSNEMIGEINQAGLGLPDRDYYLKTDKKAKDIQSAYLQHVTNTFKLAGETPEAAAKDASTVYAYEKTLAEASRTRVQLRDPQSNYNRTDVAGLSKMAPDFAWKQYFGDVHAPRRAPINVGQPDYVKAVDRVWTTAPLSDTKTYLRWHLLNFTSRFLSDPFVAEDFHFRGQVLTGAQVNRPRWKRVVAEIDHGMGEALGQAYVEKYFPPAARAKAKEMVNNLKAALHDDLQTITWMGPETRDKAVDKLNSFMDKIGYPDKWRDYSSLSIDRGPFVENVLRAQAFEVRRDIGKIGKPVDRTEWDMTPPTVNAYYNPAMNEIVFPAGILQPPFFNPNADDAINYGGIGAVIGHEMTHGFDDEGAQFDAQGNLKDWWTPEDLKQFKTRTTLIAQQYDGYELEPGVHENGKLVTGESLADLGGLTLAYKAFEKSMEGKPRPADIDGFTPEQRFFLGFAQVWATNIRPEYGRLMIATDPHPLPRFRVDGTVSNMPAFAQAWHLEPTDKMVLPPDKRTQIW